MPLLDHFRPPVNDRHTWGEVHGQWPGEIVRTLFDILPAGYTASPTVQLGTAFEIDVSTFEAAARVGADGADSGGDGTATAEAPHPTLTVEADLSDQDEFEVRVYDDFRRLVAAIEIVSPANKDRPESREAFVAKVAALLHKDVCVSVIDLVSVRQANLYAEVLAWFGGADPQLAATAVPMYAVTLRGRHAPKRRGQLDAWFYPLTVGQPLPTLPIWLADDLRVLLPLEPSYQETCRLLRIA